MPTVYIHDSAYCLYLLCNMNKLLVCTKTVSLSLQANSV